MIIRNKRARFEYSLEGDKYEAGISLSGGEAKAVRTGHLDLSQSVAKIMGGEAWLVNANIPVVGAKDYNSTRSRKLLLHKTEVFSLSNKIRQLRLTFVPTSVYTKGHLIKVGLVLGKPKREFEKREAFKKKVVEREVARELKIRN